MSAYSETSVANRVPALGLAVFPATVPADTCRDCGGPLVADVQQRASGDGPGRAVRVCRRARTDPFLAGAMHPCGALTRAGALRRLEQAWEDATRALDAIRAQLETLTADGARPTAQQLADFRAAARVAWYAELAAEAAYTRAAGLAVRR